MAAATSRTGVAVMASFSDFGLAPKDARGVIAEETVLPRALAEAKGSLVRFSARVGVPLDGAPRDVARALLVASERPRMAVEVDGEQRVEP